MIPDFPLEVLLRARPELRGKPVALLDEPPSPSLKDRGKARILHLTEAALRAGVEPGTTATQGQARCTSLTLLPRDPELEEAAQQELLDCAGALSPDFENTGPGMVTIDLGGSLVYRKKSGTLGDHLVRALLNRGLALRVGFGRNPDLARLAAVIATPTPVLHLTGTDAEIRERLAPVPLSTLNLPPDLAAILHLWGVQTLGEFTALPRHEVTERLGLEAVDLWDHAAGKRQRLLRLVRPPADFSTTVELEHEIETLEPLIFLLRRSLETLSARLAAAYLVAGELKLTLRFSDGSKTARDFRIPDPSRDVDRLTRILHTHLETVQAEAPIVGFHLDAVPARPGAQPFHLFESTLLDPNRFSETLGRLEALLGRDCVGSPVPTDTHRPDTFTVESFLGESGNGRHHPDRDTKHADGLTLIEGKDENEEAGAAATVALTGLPLRRFRPPVRVHLTTSTDRSGTFHYPEEILSGAIRGRLHRRNGPWKLSGHWWESEKTWSRQEWDIQLADGCLCRIAHAQGQWFLEGIYG